MPPGVYTVPIHGNCPRCHHYHQAATIRVSGDSSHVTNVNCEKCDSRWLSFGGRNSTCISLLSTQSVELDQEEKQVRETLINMVRSVTSMSSIASPTAALASVPELDSPGPSRQQSVRRSPPEQRTNVPTTGDRAAQPDPLQTDTGREMVRSIRSTRPTAPNDNPSQAGDPPVAVGNAKHKLRDRFPVLKRVHFRTFLRSMKRSATRRTKGKTPAPGCPSEDDQISERDFASLGVPSGHRENLSQQASQRLSKTRLEQDKEMLKGFSKKERIEWLRKQFSDRNPYHPSGTRGGLVPPLRRITSPGENTLTTHGSSLAPEQPTGQRPISDFLFSGIGDHFSFPPSIHRNRPISIDSTRFSQAATALNSDSITVTSGHSDSRPLLAPQYQPRQRSRSPRPVSLPPGARSPLRQSTGIDDFEGRSSTDSFATDRAVRSMPHNGRLPTRYSSASLPQPSSATNDDAERILSLRSQDMSSRHSSITVNGYDSLGSAAPRVNGL